MEFLVKGITEEEYGVWLNGGMLNIINDIDSDEVIISKIGFELESIKNFILDLNFHNHVIFVKVHNDKTYDIYREHLITIIKMMILNNEQYRVTIYIVSDKNEDYKNELTNFFNLSTRYKRSKYYSQWGPLIKCASMRYIGFKITQNVININQRSIDLLKLIRK